MSSWSFQPLVPATAELLAAAPGSVTGELAATESGADTFASTGTVSPPVSGTLAATESGADISNGTGTITAPAAETQITTIIARRRGRR